MAGAGTEAGFSATEFRVGIRAAMVMGLPADTLERPTFKFTPIARHTTKADVAGNAYDWSPPVGADPALPVQVPCTVEAKGSTSAGTLNPVGEFNSGDAVLTFLDEDFALVRGFTEVLLGGDTYLYVKQLPPVGLYGVTVYQVVVAARDES